MASTGPMIILPAHFMEEVRNDDRMTFSAALKKDFFSSYPGFEGFRPAAESHVFTSSVRIGLTQSIGKVTELLSQEMAGILRRMWPVTDGIYYRHRFEVFYTNCVLLEWQSTELNQNALAIIARLSARVFMPEPLCYNQEWLDLTVNYTVDFFKAAFVLRMWPAPLRPVVHWFLPEARKARSQVAAATRLMEPELARRRKERKEAAALKKQPPAPMDSLTWMASAAKEKADDFNYVWGQLNYSLGAIHTTSMTFVYVLYDLIEHSEYIPLLREEIAGVWKQGDILTKNTLYNLKLMDSFMKESQRLNPVTLGKIIPSQFGSNSQGSDLGKSKQCP